MTKPGDRILTRIEIMICLEVIPDGWTFTSAESSKHRYDGKWVTEWEVTLYRTIDDGARRLGHGPCINDAILDACRKVNMDIQDPRVVNFIIHNDVPVQITDVEQKRIKVFNLLMDYVKTDGCTAESVHQVDSCGDAALNIIVTMLEVAELKEFWDEAP